MNDFSKEEIKEFTEKFKNIGFSCKYSSFNKLDVNTNYKDYIITIHKRKNEYYIYVYRPTIGMFVNSKNCQKILSDRKEKYNTVDELINNVKDIKDIIINNSIVIKDLCEDLSHINSDLFIESNKIITEEYIGEFRNITLSLYKLYINIQDKKRSQISNN